MSTRSALLIGSTRYEDRTLSQLSAPAGDLEALASVLRTPSLGEFGVEVMLDRTWAEVMESVARFFKRGRPDDTLLFYFSGHGLLDQKRRLYFASTNTDTHLLSGSAVAASFVREEMDQCRSARQVIVLDCCHGGAFSAMAKGALNQRIDTELNFATEVEGRGRVVLTATAATEYAFEGTKLLGRPRRSVFTHHVVEGLRTGDADLDGDGRITADELYTYVWKKVQGETNAQSPTKWAYGQTGDIVLSRTSTFRPRPDLIDPAIVDDVSSPHLSRRLGALKALLNLADEPHRGVAKAAAHLLSKMAANDDSISIRREAANLLSKLPALDPPNQTYPGQSSSVRRPFLLATALLVPVILAGLIWRTHLIRHRATQAGIVAVPTLVASSAEPIAPPKPPEPLGSGERQTMTPVKAGVEVVPYVTTTESKTQARPADQITHHHRPEQTALMAGIFGSLTNSGSRDKRRKNAVDPDVVPGQPIVNGSLDKETVRRITGRYINTLKYCYEQELAHIQTKIGGRIVVTFKIGASGLVEDDSLESSSVNNSNVESCFLGAIRRIEFPRPSHGGDVVVSYPFVLTAGSHGNVTPSAVDKGSKESDILGVVKDGPSPF